METSNATLRDRLWVAAPLICALLLVSTAFVLAVVARQTGIGATRMVEPPVVASVDLAFEDQQDGTIRVQAAGGKGKGLVLPRGQDGFVRVAIRSMVRDRRLAGVESEQPFRLSRDAAGRLFLRDLATGRVLALSAYGHANGQAFAQLMTLGRISQ